MSYHKNHPIPEVVQQRVSVSFRANPESGCWETRWNKSIKGYGSIQYKGRTYLAHRAMWVLQNGPIPDGLVIDHMCFNHACVNPEHLRLLTRTQNNARKAKWGEDWPLDECRWGHKLTEMRTVGKADPRRRCGACMKERNDNNAVIFSALARLEHVYGIRLTRKQQAMVDEFMPVEAIAA